ncbi:MAG: amylo-alpha-1,6-glucosidase [Candidatus Eisenbacteria bacterium]
MRPVPRTVHPRGYEHLVAFEQDPFPSFTYEAAGVRLVKTIAALHDRNTVLIDYYVEQASRAFALELRPLLAGRDVHELRRLSRTDVRLQLRHAQFVGDTLQVLVPLVGELEIKLFAPRASFRDEPAWWHDFQYVEEQRRGYDFEEDLWTPGLVSIPAFSGDRFTVMVSLGSFPDVDPASLWQEERTRRETLVAPGIEPDSRVARMVRAADQFVVRRAPRSRTVIAGYPWFSDWGRDAMIALPGLCLVTGRHEDAREIFLTFLDHLSDGLIPNRFPESGAQPEYNTADASLWLFWAVHKYLQYSGDSAFVRDELLPALRTIVEAHIAGTSFGIGVDRDGLLHAGEEGVQLTWMDAKVGDHVVTARTGKPVEINALWLNALFVLAELESLLGEEARSAALRQRFRSAKRKFQSRFWNPSLDCLFDVVDGPEGDDPSIRPNQIFALSLVTPLLSPARSRMVLQTVERKLVTPFGLRTLSTEESAYHGTYQGDARARDAAYHQGTVWTWLAGPYATALARFGGRTGRTRARSYLETLVGRADELAIGTLPELADGNPPHHPRGAIAQAWSVGEWLRAWYEEVLEA